MLHNHVEGLEAAARTGAVLVLLADRGQTFGESAAMDYLATMYASFGGAVFVVGTRGESELERIFSLMYLGDQVSYLASLLRGMDPTPVERIGHLKKVLAPGSP
jgi:glucose/mannose-6-phosphate isomerase